MKVASRNFNRHCNQPRAFSFKLLTTDNFFLVCFTYTQSSHSTMSEAQSRPAAPRGRGSARGGRGGFSSRGGRGGRSSATNGDKREPAATEDDAQVAQLKKKYGSRVSTIKEMFPDWTDEDIVFALQETDGDLETTVERISDGKVTRMKKLNERRPSSFELQIKIQY